VTTEFQIQKWRWMRQECGRQRRRLAGWRRGSGGAGSRKGGLPWGSNLEDGWAWESLAMQGYPRGVTCNGEGSNEMLDTLCGHSFISPS
jgi:hypothetical protein